MAAGLIEPAINSLFATDERQEGIDTIFILYPKGPIPRYLFPLHLKDERNPSPRSSIRTSSHNHVRITTKRSQKTNPTKLNKIYLRNSRFLIYEDPKSQRKSSTATSPKTSKPYKQLLHTTLYLSTKTKPKQNEFLPHHPRPLRNRSPATSNRRPQSPRAQKAHGHRLPPRHAVRRRPGDENQGDR